MKVHVVDGTYELFRAYFGAPERKAKNGQEVGATVGFMRSMFALLGQEEVTHVGIAFDHTVESFRNELFDGYKTGDGIEKELFEQFPLVERGAAALGIAIWPMVEFEADDALATAASIYLEDADVEQIVICSPDKDLAQCVVGKEVVTYDRMRKKFYDEAAVNEKFGVGPKSIPDYLALVGDAADGIPGLKGWGAKSTATVLSKFETLNNIPDDYGTWGLKVRSGQKLAATLAAEREQAMLYRRLATAANRRTARHIAG